MNFAVFGRILSNTMDRSNSDATISLRERFLATDTRQHRTLTSPVVAERISEIPEDFLNSAALRPVVPHI